MTPQIGSRRFRSVLEKVGELADQTSRDRATAVLDDAESPLQPWAHPRWVESRLVPEHQPRRGICPFMPRFSCAYLADRLYSVICEAERNTGCVRCCSARMPTAYAVCWAAVRPANWCVAVGISHVITPYPARVA